MEKKKFNLKKIFGIIIVFIGFALFIGSMIIIVSSGFSGFNRIPIIASMSFLGIILISVGQIIYRLGVRASNEAKLSNYKDELNPMQQIPNEQEYYNQQQRLFTEQAKFSNHINNDDKDGIKK